MALITFTNKHHVSRALSFKGLTNLFFAFGRTTPWTDENTPPAPDPAQNMEETFAYKEVGYKTLVVRDDVNGTIVFPNGVKYKTVADVDAYTQLANMVYLKSTLDFAELVGSEFRQVGIYSGLIKVEGVPGGQTLLLPADVSSPGRLEILQNTKVYHKYAESQRDLEIIIKL